MHRILIRDAHYFAEQLKIMSTTNIMSNSLLKKFMALPLFGFAMLLILAPQAVQGQEKSRSNLPEIQSFLLVGAKAHLGNGQVIENSAVSVKNGRLGWVADATLVRINPAEFDTIYHVEGMHLYPGLIAGSSNIGLKEIGSVRATNDDYEVGDYTPNVRSAIAYNTDSRVIPTLRNNGILTAQIIPQGGTISGTSSIMQLDAWNWEDALIKEDDAIHMRWAQLMSRPGWWVENARVSKNEDYQTDVDRLYNYFDQAKAYAQNPNPSPVNLAFEAMKGVFDGSKKVFIRCYEAKEIIEAVRFGEHFDLDYVLMDAGQAWQVTDVLVKYDVPVILEQTHRLPPYGHSNIDQPFSTPAQLAEAGVRFGISVGSGWDAFWSFRNLPFQAGTAVAYGLEPEKAIASITGTMAEILGLADRLGTLSPDLDATFFLSEGDIMDMRTSKITHAWIRGREVNLDDKQRQLYRQYSQKYGLSE